MRGERERERGRERQQQERREGDREEERRGTKRREVTVCEGGWRRKRGVLKSNHVPYTTQLFF
jgi:hypothetical protein